MKSTATSLAGDASTPPPPRGTRERDGTVLKIVRRPQYGRWLTDLVLFLLVAGIAWSAITNPRFQWDVVLKYLTHASILRGLLVTLELTVIAMTLGGLLGIGLTLLTLSHDRWLKGFAAAYIWLFRGTPLLVQLIFWFNISALYPEFRVGLPGGPTLASFSGNSITPFMAAAI